MISETAYAKINLALQIDSKRNDNYHDLKSIVVPIELHDLLYFEKASEYELISNVDIDDNVITKTYLYMKNKYGIQQNVKITLVKKIPIGGGLGGESADISATLRGLNRLWELNLTLQTLEKDALELGSDTVFCLYNKPAFVSGRGEKIEFLKNPKISQIYLLLPNIKISTASIFKSHEIIQHGNEFYELLRLYNENDFQKFEEKTFNDLQKTAFFCNKSLENFDKTIKNIYKNAFMSGSGSTYFILQYKANDAKIEKNLEKSNINYLKTQIKM